MTTQTQVPQQFERSIDLRTRDVDPPALSRSISVDVCRLAGWDDDQALYLSLALYEAIINAVDHGNLELTCDMIDTDLHIDDPFEQYSRTRQERMDDARYADRGLRIRYAGDPERVEITIEDDGTGFDYHNLPDPSDPANLAKPFGRGLHLISSLMSEVRFHGCGNAITMVKSRQP